MTSKSPQELFDEAVEEATNAAWRVTSEGFEQRFPMQIADRRFAALTIEELTTDPRFWLHIAEEHKEELIEKWFDRSGVQEVFVNAVDDFRNEVVYTLKQDTELVNPQHDRSEEA